MKVVDPYPVIARFGDFGPFANVTFFHVELRVSRINVDDPQPPGYAYRLPMAAEYDPWVEDRDSTSPDFSLWSSPTIPPCPPLYDPLLQGASYYEDGLWFHVGGSVYCWCGDPLSKAGDRVVRGGSWFSSASYVRAANQDWSNPGYFHQTLGYRLVRGPL